MAHSASTATTPAIRGGIARLDAVLAAIDAANEGDPNRAGPDGRDLPLALAEGRAAHAWVTRLRPDGARDALFIAARGHHIRRWELPRDAFPRDRAGYQAWRTRLYDVHATHLAGLMRDAGYDDAEVEAVRGIVHKHGIKTDPDVQTYEDAVALAFLEIAFASFAVRTPRDTVVRALRRTWRKMSEPGREAALALPLPPDLASLVEEALAGAAGDGVDARSHA